MSPEGPPDDVLRLLEQRSAAREARDWATADALRDEIAARGWEVQDAGGGSTVRPTLPTDHGSADPLDGPATVRASVQVALEDHPEDLARCLRGLAAHPPTADWEVVVVANAPDTPAEEVVETAGLPLAPLVVASQERLGWADARTLGLRHSRGEVTILLDTSVEPTGDIVSPLLAAFEAPGVGLAGGWGVTSADGRQFDEAPPGEVDAIEGYCLAVRREALATVRGFDRRFRWYRNADLDFSFAIRDAGWRAVRVLDLPAIRHEHRGWTALSEEERDRLSRRNFYRFLDRWGSRPDLLIANRPDR